MHTARRIFDLGALLAIAVLTARAESVVNVSGDAQLRAALRSAMRGFPNRPP